MMRSPLAGLPGTIFNPSLVGFGGGAAFPSALSSAPRSATAAGGVAPAPLPPLAVLPATAPHQSIPPPDALPALEPMPLSAGAAAAGTKGKANTAAPGSVASMWMSSLASALKSPALPVQR